MKILALLMALALSGCQAIPSTISFHPNGQVASATNYILPVNGGIATPNIADNWWSGAIKIVTDSLGNYMALMKQIQPAPAPQPAPVPTPTPTPVPTPTPTPTPTPGPTPPPTASSVFSVSGSTITLDLNTLPGSMRAAGFAGSDNALYYVMAHLYAYGPGKGFVPHAELDPMNNDATRTAIFNWFDGEVLKVIGQMKANPALNLVAISSDGKDRCGFRLGPAILARVADAGLGSRTTLGEVLDPKYYKPNTGKFLKLEKY